MTAITQTLTSTHLNYQRIVRLLLALALVLVACYIYLVNSTIFKAVSRQNDLDKLAELESKVVTLEQQYLGLSSGITLEKAYSLGFQDSGSQTLVFGADSSTKLASRSE